MIGTYLDGRPQDEIEPVMRMMRSAGWAVRGRAGSGKSPRLFKNGVPKTESEFDAEAEVFHRRVLTGSDEVSAGVGVGGRFK